MHRHPCDFISMLIVGFLSLGWQPPAHAQVAAWTTADACPGCGSNQYRQMAIDHGDGEWFIYDFPHDQLRYYQVWHEGERAYARALAIPVSLQSYFDQARAIWAGNGENATSLEADVSFSMHDLHNSPSRDTGMDAYSIVQRSYLQNDIADCIQHGCFVGSPVNATAWTDLVKLLQSTLGIVFSDNATEVTFVIHLDDGSKVTFVWRNGDPAPKMISATDSNNNNIPLSPSQIVGSGAGGGIYLFNEHHADLDKFVNLVESYGATVTVTGGSWEMGCSSVAGGGTHCVVVPF